MCNKAGAGRASNVSGLILDALLPLLRPSSRLHSSGELLRYKGDGRGVTSVNGPKAGEDIVDGGENAPEKSSSDRRDVSEGRLDTVGDNCRCALVESILER